MGGVSINPMAVTNAAGSFFVQSAGLYQGIALDDPSVRNELAGGLVDPLESLPMWGGLGISEKVPAAGTILGGLIRRATNISTVGAALSLTGFTVYNQGANGITTPQSNAPTYADNMSINFYRLGSGARIGVAMDPALVDLDGNIITTRVSWDFVNQRLVPFLGSLTISSGTYVTGTGLVTLTMAAPVTFGPGDAIIVSGLTGTGTNLASLNGTFTALSATGSTVTYNAGAGLGATTITGGALTLGSGASVALPVRVLETQLNNCPVVVYDAVNNVANWNPQGSCALILI